MEKTRRRYVSSMMAVLLTAILCLSGCSVDELAQSVAAKLKEKVDAMFEGEKCSDVFQKTQEYFVQTESESKIEIPEVAEGEVQWHDAAFSQAVAYLLDTEVTQITYEQLEQVKELDLSETENVYGTVTSFEDLAYFTGLESLTIYGEYLDIDTTDFSVIGNLTTLKVLEIDGCPIENPAFAANLTELTELYMMECELSDISFVENLEKLEDVSFYGNYLLDVSPLADHNQLKVLSLAENNFLEDISPLAKLPVLDEVGIFNCAISDFSPLVELKNLKMLNLSGNPLTDLSPLSQMTQLEVLGLEECKLTDISVLKDLTEMKQLHIRWNQLTDISALSNMTKLNELRIAGNYITDFTPLQNVNGLFRLDIYGNPIEKMPENLMEIPYLDAGYYYTWDSFKTSDMVEEEKTTADTLMKEYYAEETGYPADLISGYLDEDGYKDIVIMVEKEDTYARTFYVFLGEKEGNYKPAGMVTTPEAYLSLTQTDTYFGMTILNHNLIVTFHNPDVFGWLDNSYYQCHFDETKLTRITSVNYCAYYTGADYSEYDFLNNTSSYSVYVKKGNDMTGLLLQTGDSNRLYKGEEVFYPELDPYYDFYCFENIVGETEEGFEAVLQAEFTEYEKIPLVYTEETRENYTRLTGSLVPEYYYEADGGQLYFATTYANENYEVFQVFAYVKDGVKDYYLYNMETKEVVPFSKKQYNE